MIRIDAISEHPFPTIDFKFVNRGNASAVLRKIGFEIESIEVDPTPVLSFVCYLDPNRNSLKLVVRNDGWGPAEALNVEMSEPLLDELFSAQQRSGNTRVKPEENAEVLELSINSVAETSIHFLDEITHERQRILALLPDRMRQGNRSILGDTMYEQALCQHEKWHVQEYFEFFARGDDPSGPRQRWHIDYVSALSAAAAPVSDIDVRSTLTDIGGRLHDHHEKIAFGTSIGDRELRFSRWGEFWLSRSGFSFQLYDIPMFNFKNPSAAVVAMLDPSAGPVERSYDISLTIPAGDAERFVLTVGADRSCYVRARFSFYLDGNPTIASEPFDFKIWHPKPDKTSIYPRDQVRNGTQFVRTDKGWGLADEAGNTIIKDRL